MVLVMEMMGRGLRCGVEKDHVDGDIIAETAGFGTRDGQETSHSLASSTA